MHRDVELSAVVVHAESGSVKTDDVSDAEHDGEVLEFLGVHSDGSIFGTLGGSVKTGVHNLERANVQLGVSLVGEGCIDDDTVGVLGLDGAERGLAQLDIFVLLSLYLFGDSLGGSLSLFGRSRSWHCDFFLSC